ncbi:CcmD family protein [Sphingobacterium bovistauri]|uniref:CcmD family protein n=1 Tax=Sphingobacterium bovistauri TaxID=2781959 RepID=A0ABS7Z1S3_9SPHI|nr:CcmD family protein [Sphingobacterium bovistauri]MCA5003933.1 CcmD family protein [Sphingobacterium bovistauri]
MKKFSLALAYMLISIGLFAQDNTVEMATLLRSSGKIWVVVGVILTIVIGLFIYLFTIDKRVKKLEDK